MSGYKSFAVVGAGNIGGPIIEELLNAKATGAIDKVVILSRPASASKLDAFRTRGASIVPVEDYSSVPDVSNALSGIDVVITTLTDAALRMQVPIAEAAKAAGVQLFVPSEFGMPSDGVTDSVHVAKVEINKKIHALGLPITLFYTGNFADWVWLPYLTLDVKSGSVGVGGDGNARMSFTSRTDIGRFLAYTLTTLQPAQIKDRTFRIESERASFNDIFAAYEKKHGVKLQVKYTPIEELEDNLRKNPDDVVSICHLGWALGKGTVGVPLDNDVFPGWSPKTVTDFI
ncbi:NAD-P-binding protein [Peniophora sp. CONT]|nr:NAD-P-binding protein [Peniophora sp. CONT]